MSEGMMGLLGLGGLGNCSLLVSFILTVYLRTKSQNSLSSSF